MGDGPGLLIDVEGTGVCDGVRVRLLVVCVGSWPGQLGGHVPVGRIQNGPERVSAQRMFGRAPVGGGHAELDEAPAADQSLTYVRLSHCLLLDIVIQNMVLLFAAVSGIGWITSQCSTSLPFSSRKISTTASPRGSSDRPCQWLCRMTYSPSAKTRLISYCASGWVAMTPAKQLRRPSIPSSLSG